MHESRSCIAGRFVGSGLLSFLLPGILEGWHVLGLRIQRAARIAEVTVRARQSRSSLRCGHVLGLRMLLDEASRLGADKVLLQMRGYSRRFAAPNACDLDVIRRLAAVRAGAACDGARRVAGMDEDHGVEMSVFAFPRIKGVMPQFYGVDAGTRPRIASKLEAEATPRVDVGEVSMTLVSREERQNKPASFQVFARVDGKTLVGSNLGGYACLRVAGSDCLSSSCFTGSVLCHEGWQTPQSAVVGS